MEIEITFKPTINDIDAIFNGLSSFNEPFFPELKEKKIGCFIRETDGKVIGGLTGVIYYSCLHIKYFWLSEQIRKKGFGSGLLKQVESKKMGLTKYFTQKN